MEGNQEVLADSQISGFRFLRMEVAGIAFWRRILNKTFLLCYCINIFYDLRKKNYYLKSVVLILRQSMIPECSKKRPPAVVVAYSTDQSVFCDLQEFFQISFQILTLTH